MKKFLLTALLWVYGLFGAFASADSVNWFTSDSDLCVYKNNISFSSLDIFDIYSSSDSPCNWITSNDKIYICVSTNDIPYYMYSMAYADFGEGSHFVDNSNYCFAWVFDWSVSGGSVFFLSDYENYEVKTLLWSVYVSANPIIYSSSSGGWSSEWSDTLLSGGISQLSPVVSSISTVMWEFIPYVVYIWIGILLCTLWFTAIKWLVNWFSRKITRYFK